MATTEAMAEGSGETAFVRLLMTAAAPLQIFLNSLRRQQLVRHDFTSYAAVLIGARRTGNTPTADHRGVGESGVFYTDQG